MSTIVERFELLHPASARLHAEARAVFPDGVTHDVRRFTPFPITVDRARGSRKWDVDGNEIIDYVMGHGALLLGHLYPEVEAALERQVHLGTHLGASHPYELRWGSLVKQLIPSAEKVRFTSSGTEATHLAVRLARAFTGREPIIRFAGHFHGWNDSVYGNIPPEDGAPHALGIVDAVLERQIVLPQNDVAALAQTFSERGREVAAVIIEPTGASYGTDPIEPQFLLALRELTQRAGTVLIFDEVVTGFRASPGGAQARFGVLPDLTCLAKILAGGLPGGAVCGRAAIIDQIAFTGDPHKDLYGRIAHQGTFNANPLSAVAGSACLEQVATGEPNRLADAAALRLASGMNEVIAKRRVEGCVYGFASMVHVLLGVPARLPDDGITYVWQGEDHRRAPRTPDGVATSLRQAMINEGVELMRTGALVSAVHSDADVDFTIGAFDRAVAAMQADGII